MEKRPAATFFGAPEIDLSTLDALSKQAPEIIVWEAPVMFLFVLIEWYFYYIRKKGLYHNK